MLYTFNDYCTDHCFSCKNDKKKQCQQQVVQIIHVGVMILYIIVRIVVIVAKMNGDTATIIGK
jgi:hypothetical protein